MAFIIAFLRFIDGASDGRFPRYRREEFHKFLRSRVAADRSKLLARCDFISDIFVGVCCADYDVGVFRATQILFAMCSFLI